MLWLYILGGIMLFIALILALPVFAKIDFDSERNKFFLRIGYAFFSKRILPAKSKKDKAKINSEKKRSKAKKKAKKRGDNGKEKGSFSRLVQKEGFVGAISTVCSTIKTFAVKTTVIFNHLKIKHFRLNIQVGGEDAASAAVNYGAVCACVYPLLGFISSAVTFSSPKMEIGCNYNDSKSSVRLKTEVKVSLVFIAAYGISALTSLISLKIRQSTPAKPVKVNGKNKNIRPVNNIAENDKKGER